MTRKPAAERARRRREERQAGAPGLGEQLPLLALVTLLLAMSLAVVSPAAAFPVHGIGTGFLLLLAMLLGGAAFFSRAAPPFLSRDKLVLAAVMLAAGWPVLWLWRMHAAPLFAAARFPAMTAVWCSVAFLAALFALSRSDTRLASEEQKGVTIPTADLLCTWLTIGAALLALFGLYQVAGPEWAPKSYRALEQQILRDVAETDPLRDGLLHAARERRASGTIGAANIFASFCAFGFPLAVALVLGTRRMAWRCLYAIAGLALVAGIVASGSRGGLLGLVAGATVFGLLVAGARFKARVRIAIYTGAAILFAVVLAGGAFTLITVEVQGSRWLGATGMTQRFHYWNTALEVWREAPLAGRGPASFEILYPQFRQPGANETRHAHSWLFETACAVGLLGVAWFLALLALGGAAVERIRAAGNGRFFLAAGLGGALAAVLVHGLVEYTFSFREAAMVFFAGLGGLIGMAAQDPPSSPEASAKAPPWQPFVPWMLAVGAAVPLLVIQVPADMGKLSRQSADWLLGEGGSPEEAIHLYNTAVQRDRHDPANWESRGIMRSRLGDGGGLRDLQRALEMNPYSARLRERLALYYASLGQMERALDLQREAIRLHPLSPAHRLTLVELLLDAGQENEAELAFDEVRAMFIPDPATRRRFEKMRPLFDGE